MKKSVFVIGLFFITLMFVSLVSAQTAQQRLQAESSGSEVGGGALSGVFGGVEAFSSEYVSPVFGFIVGDSTPTGNSDLSPADLFLAKLLLFILVLSIVWFPVTKIPGVGRNKFLAFIISLMVSILGIRWLGSDIVETILLPYSAFTVALTAFFPLLLYFLFVQNAIESRTMKKIAWVFAAVVFLFFYISRFSDLGGFAYIYLVSAGLCLILLFADKTIQRTWRRIQHEEFKAMGNYEKKAELFDLYYKYEEQYDNHRFDSDDDKNKKAFNSLVRRKIWVPAISHKIDYKLFELK
jgi:hypothetical protein